MAGLERQLELAVGRRAETTAVLVAARAANIAAPSAEAAKAVQRASDADNRAAQEVIRLRCALLKQGR